MRLSTHYICLFLCAFSLLAACERPARNPKAKSEFTTDALVKATPVKDQGHGELCWVYAMLATIESEHIMMGDSVNLSTDYIARMMLESEAVSYYVSHGEHSLSLRGMPPMAIHFMMTYGAMPYDSYHARDKVNYDALCLKSRMIAKTSRDIKSFNASVCSVIDQAVDYLPKNVYMYGAQYTPLEFAHSVCRPDEYVSLTSFTRHPFYQKFMLNLPDNKMGDYFLNLPLSSLMTHVEAALRSGHPVCWEGDISERCFSFADGVATLDGDLPTTQQERQRQFETRLTTDDHCMELIGLAHDKRGVKYIIAKNSWGTDNPYYGLMYLSEGYVRMKTIAVYMSHAAFNATNIEGK